MQLKDAATLIDCAPRQFGVRAAAGEIIAGPMSLVDFFRQEDRFERLGRFGIAVHGRAYSALLFSRKPIRQLDDTTIAVTEASSTTTQLLKLILENRYKLKPAGYREGRDPEADALLLIGDEALQFQHTNTMYPFEVDVAFEWWLWQHAPFVFAVWVVRKDVAPERKKALEQAVSRTLGINSRRFPDLALAASKRLGIPAEDLAKYLSHFVYRLSQPEEEAIVRFRELLHGSHLL